MAQEQQPQDFLQFSAEREAPRPGRYPHAGGKRKREDRDDAVPSPSSLAATLGKDGRTPWRYASQSQFKSLPSLSPILRLHEEIIDFAAFVAPTPAEHAAADAAILRLQSIVLDVFPAARMEIFGSRANGLVLPTSDWDVLLFGVTGTTKNMHRLGAEINARGLASKMEIIDSARVPIIKLREKASGISIDISFELQAASGLITRALINDYIIRCVRVPQFWRGFHMRPRVLFAVVSPTTLVIIIFFLVCIPALRTRASEQVPRRASPRLGVEVRPHPARLERNVLWRRGVVPPGADGGARRADAARGQQRCGLCGGKCGGAPSAAATRRRQS